MMVIFNIVIKITFYVNCFITYIIIIIIIIIILRMINILTMSLNYFIIILLLFEFFTLALADGFSQEFEWQQVPSSLQNSFYDSGRF